MKEVKPKATVVKLVLYKKELLLSAIECFTKNIIEELILGGWRCMEKTWAIG